MKSVLLVVLFFLSLALAQQSGLPLAWWAGSSVGVNTTWTSPSWFSDGSCTNVTGNSNVTYVVVSTSFNTTRVRQVLAMAENSIDVFIYNGSFSAANATQCNNLRQQLGSSTGTYSLGPQIDDFFLFLANTTYYIVISSYSTPGQFALNIFDSIATGSNIGNPAWNPTYLSSGSCTSESSAGAYAVFSWTQSTTGLYEVVGAFSYNYSASIGYTYLTVFQGNLTTAQITSGTICSSSIVIVNGYYENYDATRLYGLPLVAGQSYTAVFSGDSAGDFSNYGFFVYPSRVHLANYLATGFAQPSLDSTTCTASTIYVNNSWAAASLPAPFYNALISSASLTSNQNAGNYTYVYPSEVFVYTGNNVGSSTTAPSSCTGFTGIDNDQGPFAIQTVPNQNYTVVTSYYLYDDDMPTPPSIGIYLVFVLTGNPVGSVNTTVPTTGGNGSGTGSGSGSTSTGGGIAAGTHGTSTTFNTSTTTNGASGLVSSFLFVLVALFATLMF